MEKYFLTLGHEQAKEEELRNGWKFNGLVLISKEEQASANT